MSKIVKKQHFVPQCYLRNFAIQDRLFVLDKIEESVYSAKVRDIAQDRYFNDFPDAFLPEEYREKGKAQIIEKDLSKVEEMFSRFLKLIIDCLEDIEKKDLFDSIGVLDEEARVNFSAFLTLQLVRANMQRQQIKGMFQSLVDLKREMDCARINHKNSQEELIFPLPGDSTRSIDFNDLIKVGIEEDSITQHLLLISNVLDQGPDSEIARVLANHIWLFGVNSTSIPLWTSDNPIVIKPHENSGTGLASYGVQVVYPISPKHLLIMFEASFWSNLKNSNGMSFILTEGHVKSYNRLQVLQCYRQTYSNKENFEL